MNKTLLTALAVAATLPCFAGGFKIGAQGQKALGMAHVGAGIALDASSVYFNPGAMSFTRNSIVFGVHGLAPRTRYIDSATQMFTNADNQLFTPFSLYATKGLGKKWTVGFGAYTPFGSGVKYSGGWTGRYVLTSINLTCVYLQPSLSYKIGKHFSLGACYVYALGHVDLQKDVPTLNSAGQVGHATLNGAGSGMGFNSGAYYQDSMFSLGVTYHSRVDMKVKSGTANFSNIPSLAASNFPNTTFSANLPLPSEIATGLGIRLGKKRNTLIAGDFNYTFWRSFDSLGFDYADNTAALSDAKSPRLYQDAWAIRLGAQSKLSNRVTARGGAFIDNTPVQDGFVNPELPDNDKWGLTAGVSVKLDYQWSIDASLLYENVPARGGRNDETQLAGTFATRVIAPGIGVQYNFVKDPWKK
jgi:long-chain fatty acid transport protein